MTGSMVDLDGRRKVGWWARVTYVDPGQGDMAGVGMLHELSSTTTVYMGQTASHPPVHLSTRRSRGPSPCRPAPGPRKRSIELPDLNKLALSARQPTISAPIPIRPSERRDMNDVLPPQYSPRHPSPAHRRGGYHAPPSSLVARPPQPRRRSPPAGEHIYSTIPLGVAKGKARAVDPPPPATLVATRIAWRADGLRVELAGTFDGDWHTRRALVWDPAARAHVATLDLKPGTYRLKFIVDDQWRCANDLPTAVDDAGNLVNYIEVAEDAAEMLAWEKGLAPGMSSLMSRPRSPRPENPPWTSDIPPQLIHAAQLEEQYLARRGEPDAPPPPLIPHPPALPRHLEKVILNARTTGNAASASGVAKSTVAAVGAVGVGPTGADDNSVLPVPNHVVLNHLGTSAIKGGVLAVGTTTSTSPRSTINPSHDLPAKTIPAAVVLYA
ncbi:5'-AMP-activated kinase beta subunit [Ceratobasidium theobromae]|uniref:5'-AMP-activated kinase beta subunit n=1 Tax=Ceratobasidium theobromae TaxID=1582974 RepID=A0A5N5QVX6_9AGAM|nr:5'-AMP-activated kinase beta subunit [Ceratobasidium theobromae]